MKLETYRKQQQRTAGLLPGWRSQARRRMLVNAFVLIAALTTLGVLLIPASNLYLLTLIAGLGALAVLWTMIRTTIDCEDQAPPEALDEYQFERLEGYRSFAFRLYGFFGAALAFFLIALGAVLPDLAISPRSVYLVAGYLLLLTTLTVGGYPALALAWNKPDED
ncbi:hypothetical protein [Corynebacterium hindlerae]|uniref:hypothetical protein n=1 Tax=Corynebacterium hindlerae TaxID=699041 RepID=UPI0031B71321